MKIDWNNPTEVKKYKHDWHIKNRYRRLLQMRDYRKNNISDIRQYDLIRYYSDPSRKQKNDEYRLEHPNYMKNWHKLHGVEDAINNYNTWKRLALIFNYTIIKYKGLYRGWSILVKQRDNYTCRNCGSTKRIIAHHIFPKAKYPRLSLDLDNGYTLCEDCHKLYHPLGWGN
jgi:hypothetical protein